MDELAGEKLMYPLLDGADVCILAQEPPPVRSMDAMVGMYECIPVGGFV